MTIYANYNNETGEITDFTEQIECTREHYIECDKALKDRFDKGVFSDKVINGELVDISSTQEYIEERNKQQYKTAKAQIVQDNQLLYNAKLKDGIYYNGIKFDCDDRALLRLSAQAMDNQITARVEPIIWYDYDYCQQTLSTEEFSQLCGAVKNFTTELESKNCQINIAIHNAKNLTELEAIKIAY